MSVLAIG